MPRDLISGINLRRIEWCCDEFNITLEDLAENSKIKIDNIQNTKLGYIQLEKIAKFFGYGTLFFLEPDAPEIEKIHSPAFRTLANQEIDLDVNVKKLITQVEWHRDVYLSLLEDLNREHYLEMPDVGRGSVEDRANVVREWLGIKDDATNLYTYEDYRQKLEGKGILVFQSMGYFGAWKITNEKLIGFSITHDTVPAIFIKKTSPQRQTFTLFHELGHLLLHENHYIDDKKNLEFGRASGREVEANNFAAHCLLPNSILEEEVMPNIPETYLEYDDQFNPVANRLGISVEVIVVALLKQRQITREMYDAYRENRLQRGGRTSESGGSREYRHREPRHIFGDTYTKTVLDALNVREITTTKASNYLDRLKVADIKKLSEYYAKSN